MDDLRTQAQLVAFDPARAGAGGIGTVITRAEVAETAARGEFPATLLLDLDRVETAEGDESTAQARVAVEWDEDSLDRLLASTEDQEIALWFDKLELARAFDEDDVEGHGLRQRAAVLAITVGAVGMSATPALARVAPGSGVAGAQPAGSSVSSQSQVVTPGVERGLQLDQQIAVPTQSTTASGGAQSAGVAMGAERGLQLDKQIAVQPTQSTTGGEPAATSSSGGPSSSELAAIAGVGAVLISAAGFGVTRKRRPPAQPA